MVDITCFSLKYYKMISKYFKMWKLFSWSLSPHTPLRKASGS